MNLKKTSEKTVVELVEIDKLRQHEKVNKEHLDSIRNKILKTGIFKEPIIVDKKNLVVLDGHHRLNSCLQLGLKKIPCLMVDYIKDKNIKVKSRRKGFLITKEIIIDKAKSSELFPNKTTKHFIPGRIKGMKIPLADLI
jgi:hypothetical protein